MLRNSNVLFCINWFFLIILKSSCSSVRSYISNYKGKKVFKWDLLLKKFWDYLPRNMPYYLPMYLITTEAFKLLIGKRNQLLFAAADSIGHVAKRPAWADTSEEGACILLPFHSWLFAPFPSGWLSHSQLQCFKANWQKWLFALNCSSVIWSVLEAVGRQGR